MAVDDARRTIDDFIEQEEKARRPLSKEMFHYLRLTREAIEKILLTASEEAVIAARDYIHTEVIHPLQVRAGTHVTQLMNYQQRLINLSERLRPNVAAAVAAIQSGSRK
jgi:hypothetical protein